jgi:phage gpG-like protein
MINFKTRIQMNAAEVRKKVDQANFRSLGHAGGAIRLTARRSIRRRKLPSRPGTPPHTQTGGLKRSIRYEVGKHEVLIGPINEVGGRLWNLHEFGGVAKGRNLLKSHRFSPGEFGPIRIKQRGLNTRFHRTRLTTAAQANRATRLIEDENARRSAEVRKYPKRPFMGPALAINRPRLPKFWANSVK